MTLPPRAVGVVALAAVVALASLAEGAGRAGRVKTVTESTTLPEAGFGESVAGGVTATCKRGQRVVSGGFDNPEFAESSFILPYESRRTGGRKWSVAATNIEADEGTLTSYGHCREARRLSEAADAVEVPQHMSATLSVKCPRGRVISGGFANPDFGTELGDPKLHAHESYRSGKREWTVSVHNFGNSPGSLSVYAYCGQGRPRLKTVEETTSIETPGDTGAVTARCPRRRRAIAGGFSDATGAMRVFESHKQGARGWLVSGWASNPASLTAFAYCEKRK